MNNSFFRGLNILMVGSFSHPALQLKLLSKMFEHEGANVRHCSFQTNNFRKGLDILIFLLRHGRSADLIISQGHGYFSLVHTLLCNLVSKLYSCPHILLFYGGAIPTIKLRPKLAYDWAFRYASKIFVASGYLGGFINSLGFDTFEVPHLVFPHDWISRHRIDPKPKFISVRSFHPVYNPMMILRAFERIHETDNSASLTMVGSGSLLPDCQTYAHEKGLPVRFLSNISQDDLRNELDNHDILLNSSTADNQPLCLIEAAVSGLPFVSTNAGGIPYMFDDGEAGYMVDSDNDKAMANRVLDMLGNQEIYSRMSQRGPVKAIDYTWTSIKERWEKAFGQLHLRKAEK